MATNLIGHLEQAPPSPKKDGEVATSNIGLFIIVGLLVLCLILCIIFCAVRWANHHYNDHDDYDDHDDHDEYYNAGERGRLQTQRGQLPMAREHSLQSAQRFIITISTFSTRPLSVPFLVRTSRKLAQLISTTKW